MYSFPDVDECFSCTSVNFMSPAKVVRVSNSNANTFYVTKSHTMDFDTRGKFHMI